MSALQHLGECIGRGGFGAVFRGLNIQTGVTVAVKRVSMQNIPKDELIAIEVSHAIDIVIVVEPQPHFSLVE